MFSSHAGLRVSTSLRYVSCKRQTLLSQARFEPGLLGSVVRALTDSAMRQRSPFRFSSIEILSERGEQLGPEHRLLFDLPDPASSFPENFRAVHYHCLPHRYFGSKFKIQRDEETEAKRQRYRRTERQGDRETPRNIATAGRETER